MQYKTRFLFLFISLFIGLIHCDYAFPLETLGSFKFHDFSLAPRIEAKEPGQGGFELKDSWIAVEWTKDESVHGEFRMGTMDQMTPAIWFQPGKEGFALIEAWVEARSEMGNLRAGRIAIADGFEGAFGDGFWLMPQSQVKKRNWLFSRDEGLTYEAENKPWLTSVSVHNGESASNSDGKMWVTSRFQYHNNFSGFGILLTGSEGGTSPASTVSSVAATQEKFQFDGAQGSKIRYGTLSFFHLYKRNYWNLEGGRGEILQNQDKNSFAWGRVDISWNVGGDLNLLARHEKTQSDLTNTQSIKNISGLGFIISSADQLSSLTLFAQRIAESPEINNDEALLIFRINSSSLGI
jgi:hypothetical protein